ncbi:MAG: DNA-3-methyladenine glycosylase 2 family protein, partial [Actinomycetota bacterium]|nr:DNA-3-methyladenine glycosylase 2 family protein [Actinomycetota bacterium]
MPAAPPVTTRTWRPGFPVALHATLGSMRRGGGDPAYRIESGPGTVVWRAVRSPGGPATVRIEAHVRDGAVAAAAWGPGAKWALDTLPSCLGADDDPSGFVPRHPLLVEALRRHAGWRVPRTGLVLEALVPAVLEQKVTSSEARAAWRDLLRWYGEPAPG